MNGTKLACVAAPAFVITACAYAQSTDSMLGDLARVKEGVTSKRVSSYDRMGGNNDRFTNILDGETRTLVNVEGAGIINHIWITIAPPPPDLSRHDIIVRMFWDGSNHPSVEAPIGDFFGQGWNESYEFVSLPLAAGPKEGRALVSYFAMPFADGARIEIENDTGRRIGAFYYYVDYVELDTLPEDMGRFHAWYNHELTEAPEEGENEWNTLRRGRGNNMTGDSNYLVLETEGKGHFVGVNYYVHCPSPIWYGEGDDMFFVDGKKWPGSLHGTGTEDYFNTSWCPQVPFRHPFYGYARVNDGTGWLGRTHVYRFHIADPVYFDKSLRFSIEHGHDNCLTLDVSSVAYWYQTPLAGKFLELPTRAERAPKPLIDLRDIHRWRHEWRVNMGNEPKLWGNEQKKRNAQPAQWGAWTMRRPGAGKRTKWGNVGTVIQLTVN